jgi:hypothetical protein
MKIGFWKSSSVSDQDKDAEAIERKQRHSNIEEVNKRNSAVLVPSI